MYCTLIKNQITALLLLVSLAVGCGSDEIQLPDQPVQGSIDGDPWESNLANAYLTSANGQYIVRFLSENESVSDPCALPSPGLSHVKATFRPAIGSFSVSPLAVDNNQVQVAFELSASTSLIANGGFMEVFDINNNLIFGYLDATLDGDNTVEGRFEIEVCN